MKEFIENILPDWKKDDPLWFPLMLTVLSFGILIYYIKLEKEKADKGNEHWITDLTEIRLFFLIAITVIVLFMFLKRIYDTFRIY